MRWIALIPLRGGSKSIPKKNIKSIAGHPLFTWVVDAAISSEVFESIYVATDSLEISTLVENLYQDEVKIFHRSESSSTDDAQTEQVMLEFQEAVNFDVLCLIQATSPLTEATHFQAACQQFEAQKLDSMLTAVRTKEFLWDDDAQPLNYDPSSRPRRQDATGHLVENGAFYITKSTILQNDQCRLGGRIGIFEMPVACKIELDDPADWYPVEQLLIRRRIMRYNGQKIGALVLDVDGTLTDGGMYYSERGEELKKFNTRDAQGLQLLRSAGIKIAVITAENSASVHARMTKLGITEYYSGISNKMVVLEQLSEKWGLNFKEIAYMGDDIGDASCLLSAGLAFCPADAIEQVQLFADIITSKNAGSGAVREACEFLLRMKDTQQT